MGYRYLVRTMRGTTDIEMQLAALSAEGWEPVNFERDSSGRYEVILRREVEQDRETAVLKKLEETVDIETTLG
jgi:hypothetical protein